MEQLQRITAVVMITAGVGFAIIATLAIWGAFEDDDITWRSLATLAVIALAALIINIGSRFYDQGSS